MNQFDELMEVAVEPGAYKTQPNNPRREDGSVFEYCPPEHVAAEMDRLIQFHAEHSQASVLPDAEAAWLHHRFTQIHPFLDGNGRVARSLASLVLIKVGGLPMVVSRDGRVRYIDALEDADHGDLRTLTSFILARQQAALRPLLDTGGLAG